jgi:hypothetical protein
MMCLFVRCTVQYGCDFQPTTYILFLVIISFVIVAKWFSGVFIYISGLQLAQKDATFHLEINCALIFL